MDPNEWNLHLMLLSICLNGNCVSVGPEYCNKLVGLFEKKKNKCRRKSWVWYT